MQPPQAFTASDAAAFLRRLNWQLHFGGPPKWAAGVKFILVDVEPSPRDADRAAAVLRGDAGLVVQQLTGELREGGARLQQDQLRRWRLQLQEKVWSSWVTGIVECAGGVCHGHAAMCKALHSMGEDRKACKDSPAAQKQVCCSSHAQLAIIRLRTGEAGPQPYDLCS